MIYQNGERQVDVGRKQPVGPYYAVELPRPGVGAQPWPDITTDDIRAYMAAHGFFPAEKTKLRTNDPRVTAEITKLEALPCREGEPTLHQIVRYPATKLHCTNCGTDFVITETIVIEDM